MKQTNIAGQSNPLSHLALRITQAMLSSILLTPKGPESPIQRCVLYQCVTIHIPGLPPASDTRPSSYYAVSMHFFVSSKTEGARHKYNTRYILHTSALIHMSHSCDYQATPPLTFNAPRQNSKKVS